MLEQLARAGEAAGAEAVAQAMAGAATLHIGATTSPSKAGRPLPRSAAPSWTGDPGLDPPRRIRSGIPDGGRVHDITITATAGGSRVRPLARAEPEDDASLRVPRDLHGPYRAAGQHHRLRAAPRRTAQGRTAARRTGAIAIAPCRGGHRLRPGVRAPGHIPRDQRDLGPRTYRASNITRSSRNGWLRPSRLSSRTLLSRCRWVTRSSSSANATQIISFPRGAPMQ